VKTGRGREMRELEKKNKIKERVGDIDRERVCVCERE